MPFKPPEVFKCPKCTKAVYAAEEMIAAGNKWHKQCFTCGLCNKMLDSHTVAEHEGEVFCKNCYGKKFGPKGYGFGGGAGALNMDSGQRQGNKEGAAMSNIPSKSGPTTGGTGGERCPRCGGAVYAAERVLAASASWHKGCFRCKGCGKSLEPTTVADNEGEIYCKNCYHKQFGPKGKE